MVWKKRRNKLGYNPREESRRRDTLEDLRTDQSMNSAAGGDIDQKTDGNTNQNTNQHLDGDTDPNETIKQKYNLPPIGETLPAGMLAMQESLGAIYAQWDNFTNTLIENVDGYNFSVVASPRPGLDYFRKAAAKELKEDAAKAFTQNPDIQPSEKKMLPRIVDRIARLFKSSRPALDDDTSDNNLQNTSQGDAEMLTWTQNNVIDDTPKNINALTIIKRFEECMGPDIHAYTPHKLAKFMKGLHTEKIAGEVLETIDFKYTAKTNYGLKKSLPPTQKPALQSEPSTAHLKNIIDAKLFRYITKWYEEVR